jgi:hypothetical protein
VPGGWVSAVVTVLRGYTAGQQDLATLLSDVEDASTNQAFQRFVRRIRAEAGIPSRPGPVRGPLLELMEGARDETEQ